MPALRRRHPGPGLHRDLHLRPVGQHARSSPTAPTAGSPGLHRRERAATGSPAWTIGVDRYDYTYDANGNLRDRDDLTALRVLDHADQLVAFATQTAGAEPSVHAHYLYDAAGQRVKKLVRKQGGQVEVTHYLGGSFEHHRWAGRRAGENNRVHVLDGGATDRLVRVGAAASRRLAARPSGTNSVDHLGSSNVVVDGNGALVNREEYTPYGETSFGSFAQKRYRFTGKERDEESGLDYRHARYYAPWLGRWTSCDPAGLVDGLNVYRYARDRPSVGTDPTGTQVVWDEEGQVCRPDEPGDAASVTAVVDAEPDHPPADGPAPGPDAALFGSVAASAVSSVVRNAFLPMGPTGPLLGSFNLWSGRDALRKAKGMPGYTIFETTHFQKGLAEEAALRRVGGGIITDLPYEATRPIWVKYSVRATLDAALSGQGVSTANDLATVPRASIQAIEISVARLSGTGMGLVSVGGGVLMLISRDERDPAAVQALTVASGSAQVVGGGMEIVGALTLTGRVAAAGAATSTVGTVLGMPLLMIESVKVNLERDRIMQPMVERELEQGNYVGAALLSMPSTVGGY